MRTKVLYLLASLVIVAGCSLSAGYLFGIPNLLLGVLNTWGLVVLLAAAWLAALALVPVLLQIVRKTDSQVWILAGLLVLMGLIVPIYESDNSLFPSLILAAALVIATILLYSGLDHYRTWRNASAQEVTDAPAQRQQSRRIAATALALCILVLGMTLYNLYWLTVWDNTDDPLGYILLYLPIAAVLSFGIPLIMLLPGRTKLAGVLYTTLIPALLIVVSSRAQTVDFRQLTEERAEQVSQAVEVYFAREGHYPHDLRQLTPGYLLDVSEPVIMRGQGWCYEGGDHYYVLGYVDRLHWSDPNLFGHLYRASGSVPDPQHMCRDEIDTLESVRGKVVMNLDG